MHKFIFGIMTFMVMILASSTAASAEENPPADPAHPDHPDEVEMHTETCEDDDPSTLTAVQNEDGSTSYYAPDGTFCATILPAPPVLTRPVEAVVKPAVVKTATPAQLPQTGIKDSLPLYGAAMVLSGASLALIGKKRRMATK